MYDTMGNIDRALPAHAAICGTAKFAGRAGKVGRPKLVLKSVTRAGGLINRKPLLISSTCSWKTRPRLAAVSRLPIVVAKVVPQKVIIEKRPYLVCTQNRIAAENARLQYPGKRPVNAAVCGTAEFAGRARKALGPKLIMKPVTWPGGPINGKPLLVASTRSRQTCPGLPAVRGPPVVVTK